MDKNLTAKTRDKSARYIYYSAYLRALAVGFLKYFLFVFAIIAVIKFFYPGFFDDNFNYVIVLFSGFVSVMSAAQARAMDALRDAGLLDEGDTLIERTAEDTGGGPTLEIHSNLWSRLIIIFPCLLLCATLIGMIFVASDSRLLQVACFVMAILMGAIAVLVWGNIKRPELRLDNRGIFTCWAGLDRKFVPWRAIARARFQRVASAPPIGLFSFLESDNSEIISLESSDGKVLLTINGHLFKNSPAQKQRFIAELERRLTAATPPQNLEARNE